MTFIASHSWLSYRQSKTLWRSYTSRTMYEPHASSSRPCVSHLSQLFIPPVATTSGNAQAALGNNLRVRKGLRNENVFELESLLERALLFELHSTWSDISSVRPCKGLHRVLTPVTLDSHNAESQVGEHNTDHRHQGANDAKGDCDLCVLGNYTVLIFRRAVLERDHKMDE
jgi:hypothetical protein